MCALLGYKRPDKCWVGKTQFGLFCDLWFGQIWTNPSESQFDLSIFDETIVCKTTQISFNIEHCASDLCNV